MEEANIKFPAKNRKRYLLFPKDKIIQTITAWRYPCEGAKILTFDSFLLNIRLEDAPFKTKKDLIETTDGKCSCGKDCKPEKVRIIVIKEGK